MNKIYGMTEEDKINIKKQFCHHPFYLSVDFYFFEETVFSGTVLVYFRI